MDTSIYRQEYARFTDGLEESGNDGLPPEIQAALWQGWLARLAAGEIFQAACRLRKTRNAVSHPCTSSDSAGTAQPSAC